MLGGGSCLMTGRIADTAEVEQSIRQYWNAHPVGIDVAPHMRGSREQFDAIYRNWRASGAADRVAFVGSYGGGKALEVGCGIGSEGRYLSENGIEYYAVDLSIESLKLAADHLGQNALPHRFANADATRLPFRDGTFDAVLSLGVIHHVPDIAGACRELGRVLRPGGALYVAVYARSSYHYMLVAYIVRPLLWLLLRVPFGRAVARRGPSKLRSMYEISKEIGLSKKSLLSISTDTSEPGDANFNPYSDFYTEGDLRELFREFEGFQFTRADLRYFPVPALRGFVERHFGFFIYMRARKPEKQRAS